MSKIDFIALQTASLAYATERLPNDWLQMSDNQQNEWLDGHKWQPLEDDTNDVFLTHINTYSDAVKEAVKDALVVLKVELIAAAINNKLPSDYNELDLDAMLGLER